MVILRDGIEYGELTGQGEAEVVLDATPFYGEGGGQVGDRGELLEAGGGSVLFTVEDTQKPIAGLFVHRGQLHGRLRVGETVTARVDARAAGPDDAQSHGHAPAPPSPAQRRRARGPPGRLARGARTTSASTTRWIGP